MIFLILPATRTHRKTEKKKLQNHCWFLHKPSETFKKKLEASKNPTVLTVFLQFWYQQDFSSHLAFHQPPAVNRHTTGQRLGTSQGPRRWPPRFQSQFPGYAHLHGWCHVPLFPKQNIIWNHIDVWWNTHFSCNDLESSNWNNKKKWCFKFQVPIFQFFALVFTMDRHAFFCQHQTNVVRRGSSNACSTFPARLKRKKSTTKTWYYILDGKFVISNINMSL